jgi:hypothetical protein
MNGFQAGKVDAIRCERVVCVVKVGNLHAKDAVLAAIQCGSKVAGLDVRLSGSSGVTIPKTFCDL